LPCSPQLCTITAAPQRQRATIKRSSECTKLIACKAKRKGRMLASFASLALPLDLAFALPRRPRVLVSCDQEHTNESSVQPGRTEAG
jgi:hypothetical protein